MKGENKNMENKIFEKPEAIIVIFTNEDIITTSTYDPLGENGDEGELM